MGSFSSLFSGGGGGGGGGQSSSATSKASAATSFGGDTNTYNITPAQAPAIVGASNTMLYLVIGAVAVVALLLFRHK